MSWRVKTRGIRVPEIEHLDAAQQSSPIGTKPVHGFPDAGANAAASAGYPLDATDRKASAMTNVRSGVVNDRVDVIVDDLLHKRRVKLRTDELRSLGAAAVPRLLFHLELGDLARQTIAFYGLQFCWSKAAENVVRRYLADDDSELRDMAVIVLTHGEGFEKVAEACRPLLDDPRPEVVSMALDHLEAEAPELARMRRLLKDPTYRPVAAKHLARYHDPALTADTLGMLDSSVAAEVSAALTGLINQNADGPAVRAKVAALLEDGEGMIREMAAEYMTWHGTRSDIARLETALAREEDGYAAAAMGAAISAIRRRPAARRDDPAPLPSSRDRRRVYEAAAEALDTSGGRDVWAHAWMVYRTIEPMEPRLAYRGRDPGAGFVAARQARLRLQARLFAIPGLAEYGECTAPYDGPACGEVVAPIRDFFDPDRKNFGNKIEDSTVAGFRGMVHVGDDLAWHRAHATVVSIAAGIVRLVDCVNTWGHMVIIEHREASEDAFCSLYAHFGPFVSVRPGERVAAGQKIGTIGRSYTWENGGYEAHVHFAIHAGPYVQAPVPGSVIDIRYEGRLRRGVVLRTDQEEVIVRIRTRRRSEELRMPASWICGYVSPQWWDASDHGWHDPQMFLQRLGA